MVFDFPDEAHFLSDIDRQRVIRRLKADQQSSAEHENFKMEYFWASVKDWKTWLYAIIYMGADCPLYAFSLFLPSIIKEVSQKFCPNLSSSLRLILDTARLHLHPRPTPLRSPLRSRRSPHHHHRLHSRPHPQPRPLQHLRLNPRHDRILHARSRHIPRRTIRRHIPRRARNLPLHRQHHRLGE